MLRFPENRFKKRPDRKRMVLLEDLEDHSVREVCHGVAEYAAGRPDLAFEPWPLFAEGGTLPTAKDLRAADCLLLTERAFDAVFGVRGKITIPHVFFLANDPHPGVPSVELDEEAIGRLAAEHLLSRGYQNLAFIGSREARWSELREAGFRQVCSDHKVKSVTHELPQEVLPVYWCSNFAKRHQKLYEIIRKLPKPCGVFAANDVIACFIIETACSYSVRIPQELGVIGVDDDPIPNAAAGCAISSVQPPFRALGQQAATMLDQLRKGIKTPLRVILPPVGVTVRISTNIFMASDPLVYKAQMYIEQRRKKRVSVAEVAQSLGTTTVTLGSRFRRYLNTSPSEYILQRRLEYAKDLLRAGKLNVSEVSYACGFHTSSYFCSAFRRATGSKPGQFRPNAMTRRSRP